jgi:rubrerythrin
MGAYLSSSDTIENLVHRNNNHDKQKHFLICESCFWCASSIISLLLFASDPNFKNDKAISRCPVCDGHKISVLPFFPRGLQI